MAQGPGLLIMAVDPNESFLVKLNGQPLNIILSPKPKEGQVSSSVQRVSNALHTRRRPNDELIPRKRRSGINFYDIGTISDGMGGWDTLLIDVADANDVRALLHDPLSFTREQWYTRYRKITKGTLGDNYELTVVINLTTYPLDNTSPEWTTKGLVITDTDPVTILDLLNHRENTKFWESTVTNAYLFNGFDAEFMTITSTPTYGGTPATLSLDPTLPIDVFVVPAVISFTAATPPTGPTNWVVVPRDAAFANSYVGISDEDTAMHVVVGGGPYADIVIANYENFVESGVDPAGLLVAIIVQGTSVLYVWSN